MVHWCRHTSLLFYVIQPLNTGGVTSSTNLTPFIEHTLHCNALYHIVVRCFKMQLIKRLHYIFIVYDQTKKIVFHIYQNILRRVITCSPLLIFTYYITWSFEKLNQIQAEQKLGGSIMDVRI